MAEEFKEKRKEPRIEKQLNVDFVFFHLGDKIEYDYNSSAASLDVSCNGIRLTDAQEADISTKNPIEMKITLPETGRAFEAIGHVKWKKEIDGKTNFGVEILTMAEWEKFKKSL